jgi:hypothetical protein
MRLEARLFSVTYRSTTIVVMATFDSGQLASLRSLTEVFGPMCLILELEQYIEHVSASDRSIQILEDIKDQRRAHYIFKILLTGVEPAYQIAHPGEKDHINVDRAAWISTFEEALAKTIVHIVLSRQAEQTSQVVGSPKE